MDFDLCNQHSALLKFSNSGDGVLLNQEVESMQGVLKNCASGSDQINGEPKTHFQMCREKP